MPGKLTGGIETRAMKRGELEEPRVRRAIGGKQFGVWSPEVFNETLREQGRVVEGAECMQGRTRKVGNREGNEPEDEYAQQSKSY